MLHCDCLRLTFGCSEQVIRVHIQFIIGLLPTVSVPSLAGSVGKRLVCLMPRGVLAAAAFCRCRHGGTCDGALDPYTCLMEHRSERWFPQVYRERCVFTRPSLQQPDFERSSCSEDCLRRGMAAWLRLLRRGDLSWEPFLEQVPYSCTFTRVDPESTFSAHFRQKILRNDEAEDPC